jgi:glycogen(starch) synthase
VRILLVSQEMPPETAWGGIGTYVDVLSEALAELGVEVHVLSAVEGQPVTTTLRGGVTVHRFGVGRVRGAGRLTGSPETWRRLWAARAVARLLPSLPLAPTSVECPEWQAEGLFLGVRPRVPLVVRLHSAARQLFPFTGQGRGARGLDGRMAAWLEEESARRAHVVTSTRSNLAEMTQAIGLDPAATHAISYPVRLPALSPPAPDAPPRVVFVGRLEPRKGPEILLRAVPRVLAAVPGTRFAFVGRDGVAAGLPSSSAWLEAEARRLGVGEAVELLGQRDVAGVYAELRRATVCAFPSRWESFGNVVAEASAIGRPVVTSAIAPFSDLVEDGVTGLRVPLEDAGGWADALVALLTDRDRARAMGAAGAARVGRISDPALVAAETLEAHRHAAERFRSHRRARAAGSRGSR